MKSLVRRKPSILLLLFCFFTIPLLLRAQTPSPLAIITAENPFLSVDRLETAPVMGNTIAPSRSNELREGVTALDLFLLTKHIIGIELLDSPYKLIAADVNKSGAVTTTDIVEIRKVVLNINEGFPANTSWRFIPKSYVFPNPADPWEEPFPEQVYLNSNTLPVANVDFIAIKVGDLNLSADYDGSCFALSGEIDERAMATIQVESELPASIKAGDTFIVPFKHTSGEPLSAFQMGVGFDENALSFIGAAKGDLERLYENNFGLTETDKGRIRMLWFTTDEIRWLAKKGQNLFYLSFKAEKDIPDMGTVLWLDDGILPNRGYDTEGNESSLALGLLYQDVQEDVPQSVTARFYPNPFSGPPSIEVSSDEAVAATLWLFNAFGVRVAYRKVELQKGINTFILDEASGLPAGVYRWKVKTPRAKVGGLVVKQ